MGIENALDDRKSQTGADNSAPVLLVDLVVALPDILELVGRNALAVIGNFYQHLAAADALGDDDGLVLAYVVYSVVDEVVNDLRYPQFVGVDIDVLLRLKDDVVAVLLNEL